MNQLHEKVLDFVLAYRKKHPDFVWWFRQRDTKDRLSNGLWFQGHEGYVFVGLYKASGGSNRTRSVGLVFWYDKKAPENMGVHLEIAFNDEKDVQMLDFYKSLIKIQGPLDEKHGSKFTKVIGYGSKIFSEAEQFLDTQKPKIDKLIKEKGLQKLFIDTASFESQLKKVQESRLKIIPTIDNTNNIIAMNQPLNTILYGPPGTGKTYNTINRAIAIINPQFDFANKTRKQVKEEYERLKETGNIEFCTFHQSMSYEDFIEGIKPLEPTEGDTYLKYKVLPGILKRLATKASYQPDTQTKGFSIPDSEYARAQFYKMSLGGYRDPEDDAIFQYCIDNNYIALGWGDDIDFTGKSEREITQMAISKDIEKFEGTAVNYFIHYIKPGDYVIISRGNSMLRAIGRVTGPYEYKPDSPIRYHQFRKVEWVLKDKEIPVEEFYHKVFSQASIYQLDKRQIKKEFFVKADNASIPTVSKPENYVLIIDEINRGNVSAIFGELITLIEDDKRKGNKEALEVTLPYSNDKFSVPNNLYIIGTMNTADRSVEALDTALRRRFSFEEMSPSPQLLSPQRAMWNLWWDFSHVGWRDKDYLEKENRLIGFLGVPTEQNDEDFKESIWAPMKKEGRSESQIAKFDSWKFTGINLQTLLEKINCRIAYLSDNDHQIGHSYFLEIDSNEKLKLAFKNSIIPLLKEYFYNDFEKIVLVLGIGFIKVDNKPPSFASKKKDDSGKQTFTFINIDDNFDIIAAINSTLDE